MFLLPCLVIAGYASAAFQAITDPEPVRVPNLALRKNGTISSSSPFFKKGKRKYHHNLINDGDFGKHSLWRSKGNSLQSWIELQFKEKVEFNSIRIYATYRRLKSFPPYIITAGTKKTPSQVIFQGSGFDDVNRSIWENKDIRLAKAVEAQFLRITFLSDEVFIDEIEVYDGEPAGRTQEFEPGDNRIRVRKSIKPQTLANKNNTFVWYEHGAHKVFRDEKVIFGRETDPVCRVSAARGETEAFQVVVYDSTRRIRNVRIIAGDLKGPGIIPQENIRWHKVGYVYVRTPSESLHRQLGRHTGLGPGWYPDYLHEKTPVDVPRGKHQPLWIDVDVPHDALPGLYRGKLFLVADNGLIIPLEIELRVWDITMPVPREFKAIGRVRAHLDSDLKILRIFYNNLAALGFTGVAISQPPPQVTVKGDNLLFDWTDFDKMVQYTIDELHFDTSHFPFEVFSAHREMLAQPELVGDDVRADTPGYWKRLEQGFQAYGDHFRKKGWTDKFIFYITDEPYGAVLPFTRKIAGLKEQYMPEYPVLWIGGIVLPDLEEIVDIWAPSGKWFEIEAYQDQFAKGKKLWSYPNGMWLIDTPPLGCRMLGWAMSKYHISGIFFYSLNAWESFRSNPYEVTRLGKKRNGDNLFFYENPPDSKIPANSIRIEMLRDGWDDWEYMRQLQKLLNTVKAGGRNGHPQVDKGYKLLQEAHGLVWQYGFNRIDNRKHLVRQYEKNPDNLIYWKNAKREPAHFNYQHDPDTLIQLREQIAFSIEALKKIRGRVGNK